MYFRCGFILDFKWQGVFLKIRVVQKQESRQEKETRPNSGAQISEPTLPENLFSKENYMEKESKENLRRGYSKYTNESVSDEVEKIVFFYKTEPSKNSNRISFLINLLIVSNGKL
jgi:hypothetical protein